MKKISNEYLEKILKKRKKRLLRFNKKDFDILDELFEQDDLIEEICEKIKSRKLIQQARRNYIVASVSCLEIFLKDSFLDILLEKGNLEDFPVCYEKIFNLFDLDYILKNNIKFEDVIIESFNFQNLKQINKSFTSAMGFNFFSKLKSYKFVLDNKDPKDFWELGEFYMDLKKIISLRHEIIHEINPSLKIFKKDIEEYSSFMTNFLVLTNFFIGDFLKDLRKQKNSKKNKKLSKQA